MHLICEKSETDSQIECIRVLNPKPVSVKAETGFDKLNGPLDVLLWDLSKKSHLLNR